MIGTGSAVSLMALSTGSLPSKRNAGISSWRLGDVLASKSVLMIPVPVCPFPMAHLMIDALLGGTRLRIMLAIISLWMVMCGWLPRRSSCLVHWRTVCVIMPPGKVYAACATRGLSNNLSPVWVLHVAIGICPPMSRFRRTNRCIASRWVGLMNSWWSGGLMVHLRWNRIAVLLRMPRCILISAWVLALALHSRGL